MRRLLHSVICLLVLSTGFARAGDAAGPASPAVQAYYECLWWSPEQMERLDPNHPPPQETVVRIDRWQYSDPVGVPHPNVVTLVVEAPAAQMGDVTVKTQWLKKSWTRPVSAKVTATTGGVDGSRTYRFDLPVAQEILGKRPHRLRSIIAIGGAVTKKLDLPIELGD